MSESMFFWNNIKGLNDKSYTFLIGKPIQQQMFISSGVAVSDRVNTYLTQMTNFKKTNHISSGKIHIC